MPEHDWDLFVIGGGSGGVRAARVAASLGARVALAEVLHLGGTCVNVGCVPKKLLVYASRYGDHIREGAGFGWQIEGRLDWAELIQRKNAEVARLNGVYRRLLDQAGVQVIEGRATVLDPHAVDVQGMRHTAAHILVATGGRPVVPDIPGRELGCTSNEIFYLEQRPERILIIGGGYIGVEFAGIFHCCGTRVTLAHNHGRLLNHFDRDLGEHLAGEYRRRGMDICLNTHVSALRPRPGGGVLATFADHGPGEADVVLFATGRRPNSGGIGLERLGVQMDARGALVVDEGYATSVPSIHAIGDVKSGPELTPVALAEAMVLVRRLFGGEPDATLDYSLIPTCVFSNPPVATVGLSEEEARQRFGDIDVYRSVFVPLKHTLTGTGEKSLMKLVVARASQRVLGAHLAAPDAGEILQGFAVAMKMGATKADFDATLGIHPTAAEELVTMRTPVSGS